MLRAITAASGIAAPLTSVTVPIMVPRNVWNGAEPAKVGAHMPDRVNEIIVAIAERRTNRVLSKRVLISEQTARVDGRFMDLLDVSTRRAKVGSTLAVPYV